MRPINANSWQSIQRNSKGGSFGPLSISENLKDNTYQDTQPEQTKDIQERYERFKCIIASLDICNFRLFLSEIIKN